MDGIARPAASSLSLVFIRVEASAVAITSPLQIMVMELAGLAVGGVILGGFGATLGRVTRYLRTA
jgi:hypothetical protein